MRRDNIRHFLNLHGDDVVQRQINYRQRPHGGAPEKWDWAALMRLWVVVQLEAYVWRRCQPRCSKRQLKVVPALKAAFAHKRARDAFLDRVNPNGIVISWESVKRRFFEAKDLMCEWKRSGDKRYGIYWATVENVVTAFEEEIKGPPEGRPPSMDKIIRRGFF